jgi:hypothetical protein
MAAPSLTMFHQCHSREAQIRIPMLLLVAMFAGCRREHPPARASVDSSMSVVTTTSSRDSQTSIASSTPSTSLSTPPTVHDTAPSVHFSSEKDSLCGEFAENGFLIPDSRRKAVATQLGRPDSLRSHAIPNTHRPVQMDTVVDVFYPGLRLEYVVLGVTEGETDILLQADVSDNRYLKYPALGVGARLAEIVSAFGEPEERKNDTYRYTCAMHIMSGSTVYFHVEGDRVKYVVYRWDAD